MRSASLLAAALAIVTWGGSALASTVVVDAFSAPPTPYHLQSTDGSTSGVNVDPSINPLPNSDHWRNMLVYVESGVSGLSSIDVTGDSFVVGLSKEPGTDGFVTMQVKYRPVWNQYFDLTGFSAFDVLGSGSAGSAPVLTRFYMMDANNNVGFSTTGATGVLGDFSYDMTSGLQKTSQSFDQSQIREFGWYVALESGVFSTFSYSASEFNLQAVPEPSSLLAAVVALAAPALGRRRAGK